MGIGMTPILRLGTDHDGESLTAHGLYFFRANDDIGALIASDADGKGRRGPYRVSLSESRLVSPRLGVVVSSL